MTVFVPLATLVSARNGDEGKKCMQPGSSQKAGFALKLFKAVAGAESDIEDTIGNFCPWLMPDYVHVEEAAIRIADVLDGHVEPGARGTYIDGKTAWKLLVGEHKVAPPSKAAQGRKVRGGRVAVRNILHSCGLGGMYDRVVLVNTNGVEVVDHNASIDVVGHA